MRKSWNQVVPVLLEFVKFGKGRIPLAENRGLMTNESTDGANTRLLQEHRPLASAGRGRKGWV
jgi:hypothetical protein